MKTAVSIPDDVFDRLRRFARRARRSRSDVVRAAVVEYLARHTPDQVTEQMNRVCAAVGDEPRASVSHAARRMLKATE
jgi:metal-responsive CopG/Arc/MetJ family transcriptional regulator